MEHLAGSLVDKLGCERCTTAQYYWSAVRLVALELHMDDISDSEWTRTCEDAADGFGFG